MSRWQPHVTVATVVERHGRYLMVEERDKTSGELVFNQPAGHLEANETLAAAALRETLEETRWEVELIGILGVALYTAPGNGITYHRTTFVGSALREQPNATLDPDIHRVHWLEYGEILVNSARMRSPLTLSSIELQRRGICYPLDLIYA
jgi:ADP-ribose pyrophosphatase YjhB (NUDIX family)